METGFERSPFRFSRSFGGEGESCSLSEKIKRRKEKGKKVKNHTTEERPHNADKEVKDALSEDYRHLLSNRNTIRHPAPIYDLTDHGSRVVRIDGVTVPEGTTVACNALAFARNGKKHYAMYARLDFAPSRRNREGSSHPAHHKWVPVTVFDSPEQNIGGFA